MEENVNKEQDTAAIVDQRIQQNQRLRIQGALTTNKIIYLNLSLARHPIIIQGKGMKLRQKKLLSEEKIAEGQ